MPISLRSISLALVAVACASASAAENAVTFESAVRPILKAHCFGCHGEGDALKGQLDLRLRRTILAGGETGPAIVPGHADQSLLIKQIEDGEMPKGKGHVPPADLATLKKWVAAGAATASPEPAGPIKPGFRLTEHDRQFWSFQPVKRPPVPGVKGQGRDRVRSPIDAFVLTRLEAKGLGFSPEADRATLIRRATFDLLGLPPTPEEVAEFVADTRPDAYERLIDRLLASPHYGERWARHWLDVAGYADSEGYTDADPVRKHAWRYRDYVIKALNADKPYDQFVREQLAGDELVGAPPYKGLTEDQVEKLAATGFLRTAPDGTAPPADPDPKTARNAVVAETVKVVSTSLLGLTVGCAQCHDHRYDPIAQEDYFRLRAIFEPALDPKNWRAPQARLISLATPEHFKEVARIEAEAVKVDEQRKTLENKLIEGVVARELAKIPDAIRPTVKAARETPKDKRTPEQTKLLKEYPSVIVPPGALMLYEPKAYAEVQKLIAKAAEVRATKPQEPFIAACTEVPGQVPVTYLHARGDPDQPKQPVAPGELSILVPAAPANSPTTKPADSSVVPLIPLKDPNRATTGRRLAYANHLTDGRHPLVARVIVNRVWMHHFGRGIVATPADFGAQGERPTHPELLDWLADEFVKSGWRLKALHRSIMLSTAYRQSGERDDHAANVDPDDRLLWRMPVRRLEAEAVRDALLAASGQLNPAPYGPPTPVAEDDTGQTVLATEMRDGNGKQVPVLVTDGRERRRSIYVQIRRSKPLGILEAFDLPQMTPNCELRTRSTVAPQSLTLMNGGFVIEQARAMAGRVIKETGTDPAARVRRAWALALGHTPSEAEVGRAVEFIDRQEAYFATQKPAPVPVKAAPTAKGASATPPKPATTAPVYDPKLEALASFCHVLVSSNAFLYVD